MTEKKVDFEAAIAELEQLVESMESGELSLEESMRRFQRGIELTRACQGLLEQARQTVERLTDVDDEASATPLDPPESAETSD